MFLNFFFVIGFKDLKEIRNTCQQFSAKWEEIGLRLGIAQGRIAAIANKYKSQSAHCMKKILKAWLRNEIRPTWRDLCDAIADVVGRTAAVKIAIDKGVNQTYSGTGTV